MNKYSNSISLRIFHPTIDPTRITEVLGREPTRASWAGAPRTTRKGDPLPGTYRESYWTSGRLRGGEWAPESWSSRDLTTGIEELLWELAEHKRFFAELRSEGGTVEFFIGWFLDGMTGEVFRHDLLRKLADLQVDLSFDVYPPDGAAPDAVPDGA